MTIEIERVGTIQNTLDEGPAWDTAEKGLSWVDGTAVEIYRVDPATNDFESWKVLAAIGSFALHEKDGAVPALENSFHLFDFTTDKATARVDLAASESRTRFNEGKVDARGRFVAGTLDAQLGWPIGSLYSLDTNLKCPKPDSAICSSNGHCWSRDNRTLYFSDSVIRTIFAYDYDLATGGVSNRRVFAKTGDLSGVPDGWTVDADGVPVARDCGRWQDCAFRPGRQIGAQGRSSAPTRHQRDVRW